MNMREATDDFRKARWMQLMQTQAQSGRNIKDFCEAMGISRHSYFYWQRKLRKETVEGQLVVQNHSSELVPGGWMKLEVADTATVNASTLAIEVGGCHITATMDTDMTLLQKVCLALRGL